MLKTVEMSRADKTSGIAVTYRSGSENMFGTCPANCELNPSGTGCGPAQVDVEYLKALLKAKPRRGYSFTYSHFNPMAWAHYLEPGKTVINYSAPTPEKAAHWHLSGVPSVTVVDPGYWYAGTRLEFQTGLAGVGKYRHAGGVRIVRCPAEYLEHVGCKNCGGKDGPLCARLNRDFVIGFTAHGTGKKKAADPKQRGGCYAASGNVAIHWRAMPGKPQPRPDPAAVAHFVKTLPATAIVRHHVAGDIGAE